MVRRKNLTLDVALKIIASHHRKAISKMKPRLQDQNNCEKFIEIVRNNPVIYDTSRKEYKDIDVVTNTWKRILLTLDIPDVTSRSTLYIVCLHNGPYLIMF